VLFVVSRLVICLIGRRTVLCKQRENFSYNNGRSRTHRNRAVWRRINTSRAVQPLASTRLPEILAEALSHEERWGDHEYLARIIFDELSACSSEFTGCGIGTEIHGDTWRVINVDPDEQEITFESGNGFASDRFSGEVYTFEEFVEEFKSREY